VGGSSRLLQIGADAANGLSPGFPTSAEVKNEARILHRLAPEARRAHVVSMEIFLNVFKEIHGTDLD
jgi:hypothetical protein